MNGFQTKTSAAVVAVGFASPLFLFVVIFLLFLVCTFAFASNEKATNYLEVSSSKISVNSSVSSSVSSNLLGKINKLPNRGFVKDPSAELIEKFPMCDDFLNVEWLDKESGYGYVEHDLYLDGKILPPKKSLIYIHGKKAKHMFNLNRFEVSGQFEEVIEAIKKGKKVYSRESTIPAVEYQGKQIYFLYHDYIHETYADNHQNVCIVFPDNKFSWVVESVDAENIFSHEKIYRGFEDLKKIYPTYKEEWFRRISVGDINHDGIADYYSRETFIFSEKGNYQVIEKLGSFFDHGKYFKFGIKSTNRICKIYDYSGSDLTTDGKNYFLNTDCNLTQLSTQ